MSEKTNGYFVYNRVKDVTYPFIFRETKDKIKYVDRINSLEDSLRKTEMDYLE